MASKVELLQARREALIRLAARQRLELNREFQQLESPLRLVDTGLHLVQVVRRHHWLIALGASAVGAWLFNHPTPASNRPGTLSKIWNGTRLAYTLWQKLRA